MKKVILCRGLPGSGKSTRAQNHLQSVAADGHTGYVASADAYFMTLEGYRFISAKLSNAHSDCFSRFLLALLKGCELVIVDNTNTQVWEFENYLRVATLAGYSIEVDEVVATDDDEIVTWYERCIHDVPLSKMRKMHRRWERFDLIEWQQRLLSLQALSG